MIVKTSDADIIAMPDWLMQQLDLHEGDQVKPVVEGDALRLKRLDAFLALSGVFADDEEFDRAMEYMEQAWKEYKPEEFV